MRPGQGPRLVCNNNSKLAYYQKQTLEKRQKQTKIKIFIVVFVNGNNSNVRLIFCPEWFIGCYFLIHRAIKHLVSKNIYDIFNCVVIF